VVRYGWKAWEISEVGYANPIIAEGPTSIGRSGVDFPRWTIYVPSANPGDLHQADHGGWLYIDHAEPEGYGVFVYEVKEVDYVEAVQTIALRAAERM